MIRRCAHCGADYQEDDSFCDVCGVAVTSEPAGAAADRQRAVRQATASDPSSNTRWLSRYELGPELGAGGMATVYLGRDTSSGQPVAVKLIASNYARNPNLVARFKREALIQKELGHPGIVRVLDLVDGGDRLAIVMEYVAGGSLEDWLTRLGRPLSPAECRDIIAPMLGTLGYTHRVGVVHRDLKPSNVLLEHQVATPDRPWPKIMDFGVAKVFEAADGLRTRTGAMLGTVEYVSPEQIRGSSRVDHRADLYSVGVMLFEMAVGRLPFADEPDFDVMDAHLRRPPPMPSSLNPAVSPGLEAVILQALEKDPGDRFQSADAMRQALLEVTGAAAVAPVPTTVSIGYRAESGSSGTPEAPTPRVTSHPVSTVVTSAPPPTAPAAPPVAPAWEPATREGKKVPDAWYHWGLLGIAGAICFAIGAHMAWFKLDVPGALTSTVLMGPSGVSAADHEVD